MLKPSKKVKKRFETEIGQTVKSAIKHHCKICGAGFAQSNNYTKHLQTHNDYEMYVGHLHRIYFVLCFRYH